MQVHVPGRTWQSVVARATGAEASSSRSRAFATHSSSIQPKTPAKRYTDGHALMMH